MVEEPTRANTPTSSFSSKPLPATRVYVASWISAVNLNEIPPSLTIAFSSEIWFTHADTKKEEKPDNKTEDEKEDKTEDGDEPEGSNA